MRETENWLFGEMGFDTLKKLSEEIMGARSSSIECFTFCIQACLENMEKVKEKEKGRLRKFNRQMLQKVNAQT